MAEFDRFAKTYREDLQQSLALTGANVNYFIEHKAGIVSYLLSNSFAGKILDYGCGIGLLSQAIKNVMPQATIHGYDVSAESIESIDPTIRATGHFVSSLEEIDNDYDAIIICNVLHHIPPIDREAILLDIGKRLNRRGNLIVFEHNPINPLTRYIVKHCPFDEDAVLLSRREVRRYMNSLNLTLQNDRYIMFFPEKFKSFNRFEPLLKWCPAGAQFLMVGIRP